MSRRGFTSGIAAGEGASGGGGGGGGKLDLSTFTSPLLALGGIDALFLAGEGQLYTDRAETTETPAIGGRVRSAPNLAAATASTAASFLEMTDGVMTDQQCLTADAEGQIILSQAGGKGLNIETTNLTAGNLLLGCVVFRTEGVTATAPIVGAGKSNFTNQMISITTRTDNVAVRHFGLGNNFNPAASAGKVITDYGGWDWITVGINGSNNWRIVVNGVEEYNAAGLWTPGGTDRRPLLAGDRTAMGPRSIIRAGFWGDDETEQDALGTQLAAIALL